MRASKALAAKIVKGLSNRAQDLFLAMVNHQTFEFSDGEEYGNLISELVNSKLIRSDWNFLTHEQIFVLNHSSKLIVLVIDQLRNRKAA